MYLAMHVLAGWRLADCIMCLGTAEQHSMHRYLPWWKYKTRTYPSAPSVEDRIRLDEIRGARGARAFQGDRYLWIGRWTAHKGTRTLVRIIRARLAASPGARFTIAGCGATKRRAVEQAVAHDPRVTIMPEYRRDELPRLLAEHDIGLFTSIAEGWGLSLQEMLESGMTVYAARAGAVIDLERYFSATLRPLHQLQTVPAPSAAVIEPPNEYFEAFSWRSIARRYLDDIGA
jgi:glycosyltransferase involved in cell wall biosynthesis